MKPCTRIEIVIEQPLASRLADLLVEIGAPGYTLIPNAAGLGDRGLRRADEPTGTSTPTVCSSSLVTIPNWSTRSSTRSGRYCRDRVASAYFRDAKWVRH